MESFGSYFQLGLFLFVYCIPGFIAFVREHHNRRAILVLNVLLGWTIIGWIAAVIWSFWSSPEL